MIEALTVALLVSVLVSASFFLGFSAHDGYKKTKRK
jgi:hypothetical protein